MYKNILVPLDGSKRAEAILSHVVEVARRFDATVTLLQIVERHPIALAPNAEPLELSMGVLEQQRAKANAYLAGLQEALRVAGVRSTHRVESGPVVETIITVAVGDKADLIAMASHGRTGLSRVFYGSVAAGVLQRVDRPLLLIRSREPD